MSQYTAAPKTCLCVELDPDFFYLIRSYAERSGLQAAHANRGQDALLLVKRDPPTIVFLEADRPAELSAWEILKVLKSDQSTRSIPVVLFSWMDEEERALEEGADVFVQKPVMYVDFTDALSVAGVSQGSQNIDSLNQKGGALAPSEG